VHPSLFEGDYQKQGTADRMPPGIPPHTLILAVHRNLRVVIGNTKIVFVPIHNRTLESNQRETYICMRLVDQGIPDIRRRRCVPSSVDQVAGYRDRNAA
jgi:hypothetical protein